MSTRGHTPITALQLFEPDARAVYTLEAAASLTQLPRRLIAVYFRHGLVSPVMDPACSGWYFNDEAIRILRRIVGISRRPRGRECRCAIFIIGMTAWRSTEAW